MPSVYKGRRVEAMIQSLNLTEFRLNIMTCDMTRHDIYYCTWVSNRWKWSV